jgi:heptosyltransferase-3
MTADGQFLTERRGSTIGVACVRGYGDALVTRYLIEKLISFGVWPRIVVFGKAQYRPLFDGISFALQWYDVLFPAMSHRELRPWHFLRSWSRARRASIDVAVNWHPDYREYVFWRFAGPRKLYQAVWPANHTLMRTTRRMGMRWYEGTAIYLPHENVYGGMDALAQHVSAETKSTKAISPISSNLSVKVQRKRRVLLQPFSRERYREWPMEKWVDLYRQITGFAEVSFVVADQERTRALQLNTASRGEPMNVAFTSIPEYLQLLRDSWVIVCLDSFASHAAYACGCKAIVLYSADSPIFWRAPGQASMSAGASCSKYPCAHKCPCAGGVDEFRCIRGISVESTLENVKTALRDYVVGLQ